MKPPVVVITESLAKEPETWIGERSEMIRVSSDDPGFGEALERAEALVVRTYTIVDGALLDRAPNLKVVGRAGVGLDNIDLDACAARGVRVVHTPDANRDAVVEYVIAMLLRTLRPIAKLDAPIVGNDWHEYRKRSVTERSSETEILGIIGYGGIGSCLARAAKALSMRVLVCDVRELTDEELGFAQLTRDDVVGMDELLERSSCVSLHVDAHDRNHRLIDARAFSMMRGDVILVNTARGFVVDPGAAADFARDHPEATLILDVHDPEPIDPDSALWGLQNVTMTAHIAAGTTSAKARMSWVVRDVMRVLEGKEPEHDAIKSAAQG